MRGFTLIELLLVVAIIAVVGGLSVPFIQSFQESSDFTTLLSTINSTLRRGQQQASAGLHGNDWGVAFEDSIQRYTLFLGNDFDTRDQSFDQVATYPPHFTINTTFSNDVVYFNQITGLPSASGTVTFISQQISEQADVMINSLGKVELQR